MGETQQELLDAESTEPSPNPLTIHTEARGQGWLVQVGGELDLATVDALEATLTPLAERRIVLDLESLAFIDTCGVSLLQRAYRATHGRLTVERVSPPVDRMLRMCGVDRMLGLEPVGSEASS